MDKKNKALIIDTFRIYPWEEGVGARSLTKKVKENCFYSLLKSVHCQ